MPAIPRLPRASVPREVRRAAAAGAIGAGGIAGAGAIAWAVMVAEARLARRIIGPRRSSPPYADGRYLPPTSGSSPTSPTRTSLRLVVLGDSSAAGLGCDAGSETPGAVLAAALARAANRPVLLNVAAVSGAESTDLAEQVERVRALRADVAVIVVGGNDVTHRIPTAVSSAALAAAIRELREDGTAVVVGTCPDLGTVRPVLQPLRSAARVMSRRLAAAQTVTAVESGAVAVSLGALLGPEFAARPDDLFSADRFHPSALGYARMADVLLPSVCAAVGVDPAAADEAYVRVGAGRSVVPVWRAATLAGDVDGTEVSPAPEAMLERATRQSGLGQFAGVRLPRRSEAVAVVRRLTSRVAAPAVDPRSEPPAAAPGSDAVDPTAIPGRR